MSRSLELAGRLAEVRSRITRPDVTLIVVTKTYPVSDVQILHDLGVTDFGENRNEEGLPKSQAVPARWHFQGEIQSRKIKEIIQWADCIHSLDDLRHAEKLSAALTKPIDVFLQLSLDGDPARGGLTLENLLPLGAAICELAHIRIVGMMCVPPLTMEAAEAFADISKAHQRFTREFTDATSLSAGMSGDFEIAIDHGATHIRVGSSILGSRTHR